MASQNTSSVSTFDYYDFSLMDRLSYTATAMILRYTTGALGTFGVVANVINLVVFHRQGVFVSSCNVSLTALAVSDLFCCFLAMSGIIFATLEHVVDTSDYNWYHIDFYYLLMVRPLNTFTQVTCWITAFTAFERLISVLFPFKVKSIFSPGRSVVVITLIYVGCFILYIPGLFHNHVAWRKMRNNVTMLGTWRNAYISEELIDAYAIVNPIVLRTITVAIVVVSNVLIYWKVNMSKKFRDKSAKIVSSTKSKSKHEGSTKQRESDHDDSGGGGGGGGGKTETKEMKLLRMITVICIVFAVCYSIDILFVTLFLVVDPWNLDGITTHALRLCVFFFQTINSCSNVIIYYRMSSRFKEEILVCCGKKVV